MINRILKFFSSPIIRKLEILEKQNEELLFSNGQLLAKLNNNISPDSIHETEFKIFSQWGDDGIIQYLLNQINVENKYFIEFGVEKYTESNTRFLLMNNNWSGLVMDGSDQHINYIKKDQIYWKHDLTAKKAFITAENINELIMEENVKGNIGLLHIDIDGNDYWIWKALEVVTPDLMIVEYNSVFGIERAITVPYLPDFIRNKAHYSNLYAGTSLLALCDLAEEKGYYFVGSNSAGNNAYFVRKERIGKIKILLPTEGYVESKFREARNQDNHLDFTKGKERLKILKGMDVFNTRTNQIEKI